MPARGSHNSTQGNTQRELSIATRASRSDTNHLQTMQLLYIGPHTYPNLGGNGWEDRRHKRKQNGNANYLNWKSAKPKKKSGR